MGRERPPKIKRSLPRTLVEPSGPWHALPQLLPAPGIVGEPGGGRCVHPAIRAAAHAGAAQVASGCRPRELTLEVDFTASCDLVEAIVDRIPLSTAEFIRSNPERILALTLPLFDRHRDQLSIQHLVVATNLGNNRTSIRC